MTIFPCIYEKLTNPKNIDFFNPFAAELFACIFHSFEAGISNAISSFKLRFSPCIYEKLTYPKNIDLFNPCPAEFFVSIFHSFEAGIADAISSFK